jgi:hypothetical protein
MAAIIFNCPKCGFICAFRDVYAGRRARCLRCDQIFIIPANDGEIPQKVEPPKEIEDPLPGFYEAVLKNSLPAIFNKQGLTTLMFILLVTALKFFTEHLNFVMKIPCNSGGCVPIYMPFGWAIAGLVWGGLFWVYAEIIYSTAFDIEVLPQIDFEGGFGYFFKAFRSLFSFLMALLICLLPTVIFRYIFSILGITSKLAHLPFVVLAMFLFPMAVLTVSIGRDIMMLFRYDYFFSPIRKAFKHYLFMAVFFNIVWQLQYMTQNYGDIMNKSAIIIGLNLAFVLLVQIMIVLAMRTAGLFYRHFACYFKW